MDHGAVAGLLLGRWSLPPSIVEAVTNHHHPHQAGDQFERISRVIQAAEVLCSECGVGLPEEGTVDCSSADVLGELGANAAEIERLMEGVPAIAEKARQFLS